MEVLSLVRSMKNDFAPITRIPSDVFSLIPEYLEESGMDKSLIALTHVCRVWRELLVAHPLLWTRLDCANTDKTRVYIKRSRSLPLEISLSFERAKASYREDAFLLVVPHIGRLKSFSIVGGENPLENLTPHLSCPIPLLRALSINLICHPAPVLEGTLLNGDLSSLRTLSLAGVITHLPWENLSELTAFTLSRVPIGKISITQFLDFLQMPIASGTSPSSIQSQPLPTLPLVEWYPYHVWKGSLSMQTNPIPSSSITSLSQLGRRSSRHSVFTMPNRRFQTSYPRTLGISKTSLP